MTFLELVKRLRQECLIAGTGPTSVTGQSGEMQRLVDWIADAWIDIQNERSDWRFLRDEFSFNTQTAVSEYIPTASPLGPGLTKFRCWYRDTLRIYNTSIGVADEQYLTWMDYDQLRDTYRYATRMSGRPMQFAFRPKDEALMLDLIPDTTYTIVGEYQKRATRLSANEDVPGFDDDLHMVIVWKAMLDYGYSEVAQEVLARASDRFESLMTKFRNRYLPDVQL